MRDEYHSRTYLRGVISPSLLFYKFEIFEKIWYNIYRK
nr:MAG TPA: hypothetical protein [Caudoviricetes sp.]